MGEFANNARAYVMASRPSDTLTLMTDNAKSLFRKLGESDGINRVALEHVNETYDRAMKGDFATRDQVKERERTPIIVDGPVQKDKAIATQAGERDASPAMAASGGKTEKGKSLVDKDSAAMDERDKKEIELIMPQFTAPGGGRSRERERGM